MTWKANNGVLGESAPLIECHKQPRLSPKSKLPFSQETAPSP